MPQEDYQCDIASYGYNNTFYTCETKIVLLEFFEWFKEWFEG